MDALWIALAVVGMTALVPLMIWGGTGSWRHALHAWKEYGIAMAVLCVPPVALALLMSAWEYITR